MPGSEGLLQRTWAKQSRCFRNETLPMPLRSMPPMPLRSMPPPPDRCARTPRLKNQALLAIRGITLANRAHIAAQCSSVNSSSDLAAISFRPLHSAATMAAPASTS